MSLINDVLCELNGRPETRDGCTADPIRGLRPIARRPGWRPPRFTIALAGSIVFTSALLAALLIWPKSPSLPLRPDSGATPRADVSARPPAATALPGLAPTVDRFFRHAPGHGESAPVTLGRTKSFASLRAIASERTGTITRIRFALSRAVEYAVRSGRDAREFKILLPRTELAEALEPIDLGQTTIDELEARPSNEGLSVRLALSGRSRVQSQLVRARSGYQLLLDFESFAPEKIPDPTSAVDMPTTAAKFRGGQSPAPAGTQPKAAHTDTPAPSEPAPTLEIVRHTARADGSRRFARDRAEADYRSGMESIRRGDLARAIADLERSLSLRPRDLETRRAYVTALLAGGRVASAQTIAREGLEIAPESISLRLLEARALDGLGRTREAIVHLRRKPPSPRDDPAYHAQLAGLERKQGQSEQAARRYQRIVRVAPHHAAWWLGLGLCLDDIGRGDGALSAYRIARTIGQLEPEASAWMPE